MQDSLSAGATAVAHFPFAKNFEQFDFGFQPIVDERQIRELRSPPFDQEASNVIFLVPVGVAKTHLSLALAEEAFRSGLGTCFITPYDLAADLGCAYRKGRVDRRIAHVPGAENFANCPSPSRPIHEA